MLREKNQNIPLQEKVNSQRKKERKKGTKEPQINQMDKKYSLGFYDHKSY